MKKIRGIRKRWMVNSISVVLFIVLLAVTAFSAAMGSYYYSTMSESLRQKAENAIGSFQTTAAGTTTISTPGRWWQAIPTATSWRWSIWTAAGASASPARI